MIILYGLLGFSMVVFSKFLGEKYSKAGAAAAVALCVLAGLGLVKIIGGSFLELKSYGAGPHFCVANDVLERQTIGYGPTIEEAVIETRKHCFYECTRVVCENGVQR